MYLLRVAGGRGDLLPHGFCFLWQPRLLWLHIVSDGLVGLAYLAISATLAYLVYRAHRDLPFSRVVVAFGLFIIACGATHFMEIWTLWHPDYWVAGGIKAITALASVTTAIALPPLVPKVLQILDRSRLSEEHRKELDRVFDLSVDLLCIVDVRGDLRRVNRAWHDVLGYDIGELPGHVLLEYVHPEDEAEAGREWAAFAAAPESVSFEHRYRCSDGDYRWLSWRSSAPDEHGLMYAIGRDITEQKAADLLVRVTDEQLRHAQKMEAIGNLAGGMAHDFNNLLTAVRVTSELLRDDFEPDDPKHADVEEIIKAADRGAALTRQLLAYGRRQINQPQVLDLNAQIVEKETMLQRLVGADVTVIMDLEPGGVHVAIDPGQLDQLLMNLSLNARDAMMDGGFLTFESSKVEIGHDASDLRAVPAGVYSMLSVADSGTGMSNEVRDHLFEPFFSTKERTKGSGLGMYSVYGIVQQAHGHIRVESAPGEGTTVRVYLPWKKAEGVVAPDAVMRTGVRRSGATILVVDDEEAVRRQVRRVLQRAGHRVLEARHGADGLQVCESHEGTIDLLLTDLVMPVMNGGELAQRAAKLRPSMQVLYMTGYTDDEMVRRGLPDRSAQYLAKPFSMMELTSKVNQVLGGGVGQEDVVRSAVPK